MLLLSGVGSCGSGGEPSATPAAPPAAPLPAGETKSATIDSHSLTLPAGLKIEPWVSGQGSLRMMALAPDGILLVTDMRGRVLGFRLSDDGPAAITVLQGLDVPSGIFMEGNTLYLAEETRVSRYEYQGGGKVGAGEVIISGLPAGGHSTRTVGVGPDRKLYVTVGSSCNVCEEKDSRRAAMSRYNLDGTGGEVIATGLRNTVGFTWHPQTGEIWGTDNGRDNIGDDIPPDEINIIAAGKDYGWPYCYGDGIVNPEFADKASLRAFCQDSKPPQTSLPAHSAPLGLRFLTEPAWPAAWQGNLFVAFHGSWNRTVPTGYKVVRIDSANQVSDFITGWLEPGGTWGRPVDILFSGNKMYITDDAGGAIYRVAPE